MACGLQGAVMQRGAHEASQAVLDHEAWALLRAVRVASSAHREHCHHHHPQIYCEQLKLHAASRDLDVLSLVL